MKLWRRDFFRGGLLGAGVDRFKQPPYRIGPRLPPISGRLLYFLFFTLR